MSARPIPASAAPAASLDNLTGAPVGAQPKQRDCYASQWPSSAEPPPRSIGIEAFSRVSCVPPATVHIRYGRTETRQPDTPASPSETTRARVTAEPSRRERNKSAGIAPAPSRRRASPSTSTLITTRACVLPIPSLRRRMLCTLCAKLRPPLPRSQRKRGCSLR